MKIISFSFIFIKKCVALQITLTTISILVIPNQKTQVVNDIPLREIVDRNFLQKNMYT